MQNKGLVRILAVCLALVCAFYLSFSLVTSHYDKKAKEYAGGDDAKEYLYLDSIAAKKVWFGYTLKECREKEINLGLDLKGGMNVTMEVSVPDILDALSGHNETPNYKEALAKAKQKLSSGKVHVFDARKFTVNGAKLESFAAAISEGDEREALKDGYFHESEYRSAPYFDLTIDGVTLLNTAY